jgi:hypothetical protein
MTDTRPLHRLALGMALAASAIAAAGSVRDTSVDGAADVPLLRRVAGHLAEDDLLDLRYSYRVHRQSYDVSALGKVTTGPERVYDVGPSPVDPSILYRRLVSIDGRPLSPRELQIHDDRHRREVERTVERRRRETPDQRATRLRQEAAEAREREARLDDLLRVYRFDPQGHETVDGERLLVVAVTPRPDVRTKSSMGKHLKKGRGRAWVHEQEAQLARIEMELIGTVSIGLGVIGHVDPGSRMLYRRARLPDGTWAPVEARFAGTGASLVFRSFAIETWAMYTEYRRRADAPSVAPRDGPSARAPR